MRRLLFVLGAMYVAPLSAAEPTFPYKAYVASDEVHVRSGPGQSYYPTDMLKRGAAVEVYRHDPGGWCAIRPPEGSFCWVNARFVAVKGDGLAEITGDSVACRVGSRFSDVRDIVSVKLKRGEIVELLDERELKQGENAWCRIAPPAGEFRWVFAKYIDANYPHDGLKKPAASNTATEDAQAETAAESTLPSGAITSARFRSEVEALELELAIVLAEEPAVWSFSSLRKRAESLLEHADSPVERGHARVLLGKIDRFEGIKQRYESIDLAREETDRAQRLFAGANQASRNMVPPPPTRRENRFDGTGRLTEIRSSKPGGPRFALVDTRGQVQYYVTPAPGMNLRYYVGREVGITGTRGYMPEQKTQHLMARQVSSLDGTTLR